MHKYGDSPPEEGAWLVLLTLDWRRGLLIVSIGPVNLYVSCWYRNENLENVSTPFGHNVIKVGLLVQLQIWWCFVSCIFDKVFCQFHFDTELYLGGFSTFWTVGNALPSGKSCHRWSGLTDRWISGYLFILNYTHKDVQNRKKSFDVNADVEGFVYDSTVCVILPHQLAHTKSCMWFRNM